MAAAVFELMASLAMDTSKFDSQMSGVQKKLSGFASKAQTIGGGLTSVGNALTNKITKPAMVAGGALAGISLTKGWARMTEIDNAKVKLEAIGLSAKDVSDVSDAALGSVEDTAYGLAEAMTTAASATAAGIDPSTQLQQYLTDVADAAAVAGVDMAEMGGIFNKVATQGKAGNDTLSQMAERGIPIYQWLAEETGHTAEEIFEMASNGEIDLATFQKAVEDHIGGAAKEMGSKTITGAMANLNAAIGRVGAAFLGSADDSSTFAGRLREVLNDAKGFVNSLTPKVEAVGKVFGQVFGAVYDYLKTGKVNFEGMGATAQAIFERMQPTIDVIKNMVTWFMDLSTQGKVAFVSIALGIGPALQMVGKLFTAFSSLSGIITRLPAGFTRFLGPIGLAVGAFMLLWTKSEEFRSAVTNLVTSLVTALAPAFQALGPMLNYAGTILSLIANIVGPILATAIRAVTPLIVVLGKTFSKIVAPAAAAMNKITSYIKKPGKAAKSVKTTISNAFKGAKDKAVAYMQKLKEGVEKKIKAAKDKVKAAVDKIKGFFPLKLGKIFSGLKLPHFSISTGSKDFGKLGSIKYPTGISVKWYKRAEENPYLFSNATLFGAGEGRQDEMLYGHDSLMSDIREAVSSTNKIDTERLAESLGRIIGDRIADELEGMTIVLDKRQFGKMTRKAVGI